MQGLVGTDGCPGTSAVTLFSTINNLIVTDTSQHGSLQCKLTLFSGINTEDIMATHIKHLQLISCILDRASL